MKKIVILMCLIFVLPLYSLAADFTKEAEAVVKSGKDVNQLLKNTKSKIDVKGQKSTMEFDTEPLVKGFKVSTAQKYSINNFILYGTNSTKKFRQVFRKEMIKNFIYKNKKLPESAKDWEKILSRNNSANSCLPMPNKSIIPNGYDFKKQEDQTLFTAFGECSNIFVLGSGNYFSPTSTSISVYNSPLESSQIIQKLKNDTNWKLIEQKTNNKILISVFRSNYDTNKTSYQLVAKYYNGSIIFISFDNAKKDDMLLMMQKYVKSK
ncbi:MAG: hypothetical protein WCK11_00490 [Candidatus Falkowbacteria bacterium]